MTPRRAQFRSDTGEAKRLSERDDDILVQLIGRRARSFAEFAIDHASHFGDRADESGQRSPSAGDANGSYGRLPGVDLSTTDTFDENPAAYGFKKCP
jgi:hypothetical protein